MAKEENKDKPFEEGEIGYIKPRAIEEEMQESYLDYAMSVIVSRALPDVRDGLKPVHRRILFAMNKLGLRHTARYRKSATVVGEVLGKYHPHGDTPVYESMVRMAQDFAQRYLLVDGQGNFGSMDGDSPAAMRYTEAKMTSFAEELLVDIDRDTVDFVPNYDGTQKEPSVLPAGAPNLLLNGAVGIAVGMATTIPPHNLGEIIDATIELINNPEATLEDLMEHVQGPDFPTGGTIYDIEEFKAAYGTGKGKVIIRAVAEVEESKKGNFKIIISEIPYQVNKASLIEKIAELVKNKRIQGIVDLRDESDREGIRVVIDLKKDAYPKKILNQLYKLTQMQTTFHVNMLALVDGLQPRVLTLKMILEEYIKHRQVVVTRRCKFDLNKAKERAHILEGLLIALGKIDEVIKTIKGSKTKEEAHKNLIKKFKLTSVQSQAILDMRLQTLAGLERKKIEDEYKELKKKIAGLEDLLRYPKKILAVIKKELIKIKEKYADPRRTKIVKRSLTKFNETDFVPNEEVIVTLTKGNYIKRMLVSTYKSQHRGGKGIIGMATKEEDIVEHMARTYTHSDLLFFTNLGRVFQLKAYEVPVASRTAKGQAIVNLIQLAPSEVVTALVVVPDFKKAEHLMMATKKGVVKKTYLEKFSNVRKSGLIAIKLDSNDELKWVKLTSGKDEVMVVTSFGQAIRFKETDVRPMGRATRGVRGIRLRPNDQVVGMDIIMPKGEALVVMKNGYGKRTNLNLFTAHRRGGVGIKTASVTKKTGKLVDFRIISEAKGDLIVISHKGQIIRLPIISISRIGRATQGVRVMRLNENDLVASVVCVGIEEIDEEKDEKVSDIKKESKSKKITEKDKTKKQKIKKPTKSKVKKSIRKK